MSYGKTGPLVPRDLVYSVSVERSPRATSTVFSTNKALHIYELKKWHFMDK